MEAEARASLQQLALAKGGSEDAGGSGGGSGGQFVNVLCQLLRLRQACNHPWLLRSGAGSSMCGGRLAPRATAAEIAAVRRLAPDTQAALLSALREGAVVCGDCGDVPEDASVTRCGHVFCRQCLAAALECEAGGNAGEQPGGTVCATCGGALRASDTFRGCAVEAAAAAAAMGTPTTTAATAAMATAAGAGGVAGSSSGSRSKAVNLERDWHSSSKLDALLMLLERVRARNRSAAEAAAVAAAAAAAAAARAAPLAARSRTDALLAARLRRSHSPAAAAASPSNSGGAMGALRASPGAPATAAALAASATLHGDGRCVAPGSASSYRPEKVLVFSQWTGMLDLAGAALSRAGIVHRRLDGTMTVPARERAIADFEAGPDVLVLLVVRTGPRGGRVGWQDMGKSERARGQEDKEAAG